MDALRIGPIKKLSPEERIDAEKALDRAQRRVRDLVSRLNSTNLAVALPAETLLKIFMCLKKLWEEDTYCQFMGYGDAVDEPEGVDHLSWTLVAGVCRRWRSITLGAPTLWASIRLLNLVDVKTALDRSRSTLLNIEGTIPTDGDEELLSAWRLVSQHSHRIRSLSVNIFFDTDSPQEDSMDDIGFGTFGQLKILQISLHDEVHHRASWVPTGMSRSISQSSTLEHLSGTFLKAGSLRPLITPTLRRLDLGSLFPGGMASIEVHRELLGILGELIQLESLQLTNVLPYDDSLEFDLNACTQLDNIPLFLGNPISMPSLSSLKLETTDTRYSGVSNTQPGPKEPVSALAIAVFLRHLALPPSTSVTLSNWKCSLKELDLLVSSKTRSTTTISNPVPIRTIAIQVHACQRDRERFNHVELSCWEQELAVAFDCYWCREQSPVLPTTEKCTFKVSAPNCTADPREFTLEQLLRRVPLHSVLCLSLSSSESDREFYTLPKATRAVLETASEVRTLVVQAAWTARLPCILAQDSSSLLLFPKLHTIHIVDHALLDSRPTEDNNPTTTAHDIWMLQLLRVLESDRSGAERLKRVFVTRSKGFSSKDIEGLRMYADEVICE